ncbi:hypothetical protein BCV72DRAFT_72590 [Rhizopus microsporus var. microsporus]|nr:hypothetical protein BCV72DRAFT_72590 [Rhizopus microsporus var. microsporus]
MALIKIFSLLGHPRHFTISDNRTEFKNELINSMIKLMTIDKRTVKVLAKIVEDNGGYWHYYVPAVQLMLNNKVSKRLNSTLFSLMFVRRMNDIKRYDDKGEIKEMSMTHEELMNRIDYMSNIIFPAIAERIKAYTDIQKGIADKKHWIIDYPERSYVMVRVRDRYNNLTPAYQGPYSVVRKTTGGSYVLKDEEGILISRNYSPEELKSISQGEYLKMNYMSLEQLLITEANQVTESISYAGRSIQRMTIPGFHPKT